VHKRAQTRGQEANQALGTLWRKLQLRTTLHQTFLAATSVARRQFLRLPGTPQRQRWHPGSYEVEGSANTYLLFFLKVGWVLYPSADAYLR
jgi:hypothetical protein